ncbi:MAG: DNA-3-methyladenine glycosylase 2 family protein [Hyphomicrobiales bacterium]|nr:DNA-3-methyladenine glycosylase 2 family protein [Hyphomicrobiales bacterium]
MRVIATDDDVAEGLVFLARHDGRLKKVIEAAGPIPLRRGPDGLAGLARIVVGQQVSVASAAAIWARFEEFFANIDSDALRTATDDDFRAIGLSAPKIRTMRAVATACRDGFDFDRLATLPAADAHESLLAIKGIGPWTADIYLLFCLGHPDVFPAGDLALRNAVADAFCHGEPIPIADLRVMAEKWSPWRGVAARLFWAYYRVVRQRAAVPV